jgi:hypothetical protein
MLVAVTVAACAEDFRPVNTEVRFRDHRITDMALPNCGFWTRRGTIWAKSYADGSELEAMCRPKRPGSIFPAYALVYRSPVKKKWIVGRCVFRSGCNSVVLNEDISGTATILVSTFWETADGRARVLNSGTGLTEGIRTRSYWFDARTLTLVRSERVYELSERGGEVRGCNLKMYKGKLLSNNDHIQHF